MAFCTAFLAGGFPAVAVQCAPWGLTLGAHLKWVREVRGTTETQMT